MIKMKIFKMSPENSEEIGTFLNSVNILANGIFMSEDNIGYMYKELTDVGMEKKDAISAISGELAKSQKQFLLQEGLVRAYDAIIEKTQGEINGENALAKGKQEQIEAFKMTFDGTSEKEYQDLVAESKALTQKHSSAPKKDKEGILKKLYEVNEKLKNVEPKFQEYLNKYNAQLESMTAELSMHQIKAANLTGIIKENTELRDTAIADRDHATVFIGTSKKLIEEIQSGEVSI